MLQKKPQETPVSPDSVADFLISESRERGDALSNLKLQKLLYYADGWHLALYGEPLLEEDFQAWVHGPVLPSQYRRFKDNQWRPIAEEVTRPKFSAVDEKFLNEIVDIFGVETAVGLELMTHREAPWLEARGDIPTDEACTSVISKQSMQDYFRSLMQSGSS